MISINDATLTTTTLEEIPVTDFHTTVDMNMVFHALKSGNIEFLRSCNNHHDLIKSNSFNNSLLKHEFDSFTANLKNKKSEMYQLTMYDESKINVERLPLTTWMINWALQHKKFRLVEFLFSLRERNIVACGCEIVLMLQTEVSPESGEVMKNCQKYICQILTNMFETDRRLALEILRKRQNQGSTHFLKLLVSLSNCSYNFLRLVVS